MLSIHIKLWTLVFLNTTSSQISFLLTMWQSGGLTSVCHLCGFWENTKLKFSVPIALFWLFQLQCPLLLVLVHMCGMLCVLNKDPRYILHRVVSFSCEIIVFTYVPLRECVPRSHFSRFLWERITCWNSFWNGLVPSHLGTHLPISLSACLLYLFLILISKEKKKKYNNY